MTVLLTHAELLVSSATPKEQHERLNDYIPNEIEPQCEIDLTSYLRASTLLNTPVEYAEIFEQFRQDLNDDYSIHSDFSNDDSSNNECLWDNDEDDSSIGEEQAAILGIKSNYGFGENDSVQLITSHRRRRRHSSSVTVPRRLECNQGDQDGDIDVDVAQDQYEELAEDDDYFCHHDIETFVALKA